MAEGSETMTLRLLTPAGVVGEAACDSVQLILRDGVEGRGGGSVGIWRHHAPAVMALGKGPVRAYRRGEAVFAAEIDGGFASVRDDAVTVITDSVTSGAGEAPPEADK